jgi:hypothetical protein
LVVRLLSLPLQGGSIVGLVPSPTGWTQTCLSTQQRRVVVNDPPPRTGDRWTLPYKETDWGSSYYWCNGDMWLTGRHARLSRERIWNIWNETGSSKDKTQKLSTPMSTLEHYGNWVWSTSMKRTMIPHWKRCVKSSQLSFTTT